jgi:hypothetical protein
MVKGKRFLSILTTAIILAMLIVVIPVTPALAVAHIAVTPTSGTIGDYVEIDCSGFTESTVDLYFYFSSDSASVGDYIDEDVTAYERVAVVYSTELSSSFIADFDVPDRLTDGSDKEDVTSGTYYVYAAFEDDDEIVAKDDFRVIVTELSISPTHGVVGTEVDITGSGFSTSKSITIKYDTTDMTDEIEGDTETDSSGEFSSTIAVPESAKGDHTITVTIGSDKDTAKFTVEPAMTISPTSGTIGDSVKVTGTGFAKSKEVTITFDSDEVATDETDSYGSFETTFSVPEVAAGSHDVEAKDASNNSKTAQFTITTHVGISPTTSVNSPGHVGEELTISGTGFKPSSDITITYASDPTVFHTTSQADGSFSYTLEVPASEHGEHTITASDGTSSMSVKFYMESTPPETPPPLLPYMDGKADSQAKFDWEDVTTDTNGQPEQSLPITYEIQIATDTNFTNLLLDKKGLITSEYTLTKDEALASNNSETPYYYWRLRAVDAASNASPWTGTGQFKVGFSFNFSHLSGWLLYVLIGVGALVLFFIGFWLGRRGGGEYY